MFVSLCYVVFRRLLQLVVLRMRSSDWKELEIVVLQRELAILVGELKGLGIVWDRRALAGE